MRNSETSWSSLLLFYSLTWGLFESGWGPGTPILFRVWGLKILIKAWQRYQGMLATILGRAS